MQNQAPGNFYFQFVCSLYRTGIGKSSPIDHEELRRRTAQEGSNGDEGEDSREVSVTNSLATQVHRGYCSVTDNKLGRGDCARGAKGFLPTGKSSGIDTFRDCIDFCHFDCARCRYVSFSLRQRDCSWYHDCENPSSHERVVCFRSGRVSNSLPALPPPPLFLPRHVDHRLSAATVERRRRWRLVSLFSRIEWCCCAVATPTAAVEQLSVESSARPSCGTMLLGGGMPKSSSCAAWSDAAPPMIRDLAVAQCLTKR